MREIITTPIRCVYMWEKVNSRHYDNNKWASINSYKTVTQPTGLTTETKEEGKINLGGKDTRK